MDARRLAAALRPLLQADGSLSALPPQPTVPASAQAAVGGVLAAWLAWYDSVLVDAETASAWNPARLEYSFAAAAPTPEGELTLSADDYADGQLDWYAVRGGKTALGAAGSAPTPLELRPVLPAAVQYGGKPADRYWECEDESIYFGALSAGPTDLSRLLLVEFALVYGNDWFVIPLTLPVGTATRVRRCVVRDTFGIETVVTRSRDENGNPWALFELTEAPAKVSGGTGTEAGPDSREWFFLAPTLAETQKGEPLERLALFRDEMANMAWAVEHIVQGVSGAGYSRFDEAARREGGNPSAPGAVDAPLRYQLATSVPQHWLPLVPVLAEGANPALAPIIQFERRALLRPSSDGTLVKVEPKGQLLRTAPQGSIEEEAALRIEEEEIGREGAIVERAFQLTRWFDGRSLLWL